MNDRRQSCSDRTTLRRRFGGRRFTSLCFLFVSVAALFGALRNDAQSGISSVDAGDANPARDTNQTQTQSLSDPASLERPRERMHLRDRMVWIDGGSFQMGSNADYSRLNERPSRAAHVDGSGSTQLQLQTLSLLSS